MKIFGLAVLAFIVAAPVSAGGRSITPRPDTQAVRVVFNGENLRAWYLLLDARDPTEREKDAEAGRLKGPVIVFFQGHAQRPSDVYVFSSKLALGCRSGIVVVPVSDTPYGDDENWRGDRGKEVVLMAVVARALASHGIGVPCRFPPDHGGVEVQGGDSGPGTGRCPIFTRLIAVGWSHGGILARRFAHSYPGTVTGLGQVCSAGYEPRGPVALAGRFLLESVRSSKLFAAGHAGDTLRSAWGFTRGFVGDFARSVPDAVTHCHPAKIFRAGRDIGDCSLYCDGSNMGVADLERVAVIFGADDTCMSLERILGQAPVRELPQETLAGFWEKYYPGALSAGTALSLKVLPGTHLAPVIHSGIYADCLLRALGEHGEPLEGKGEGML